MRYLILLITIGVLLVGAGWFGWQRFDQTMTPQPQTVSVGEKLTYLNEQYRFALELPESWREYRAWLTADEESEGALVHISLPVERYRDQLEAPQDLQNGVIVAGIEVFAKDYVGEQRALCEEEQELIDRYQVAIAQDQPFEATAEDQDLVDDCLSLRDPQSADEAIRAAYLGEGDQHYYFRVPLSQFDNGFREVPSALESEVTAVYASFQVR